MRASDWGAYQRDHCGITIETALLKQYPIPVESWRNNRDHFYLSILPLVTRLGYVAEPLHAARSEAAWVLRDSTPAGLRLGALGKITARGLLPPGIHHWMQLIRRHLWA